MSNATYHATLFIHRNHEEEEEDGWFPYDFLGVTVALHRTDHNIFGWVKEMVDSVGLRDLLDGEGVIEELQAIPFDGAEVLAIDGRLWSHQPRSYYDNDDYEDGFDIDNIRLPRGDILTCPECMLSYEDPTPICTGCTFTVPVPHQDLNKVQGPIQLDYPNASYADMRVFAELDWTPANVLQEENRLHRIGQSNSVLVQHLVLDPPKTEMLPMKKRITLRDRIIIVLSRRPNYERAIIEQVKRTCPWWQRLIPSPLYYPLLRDMERDGILTSYEKNDAPALRGGIPRRYYALKTPEAPFSTITSARRKS